jgi:hypothetical protein
MYKNLEMFLVSGNSLESLVTYDFKNESPWPDVNNEANSLKKFQLYKAKEEPKFDCDSSNGTCPLASDIYNRLWGWTYENRFHLPERLSSCFQGQWERMGSDTMNSFSTIYRTAKSVYSNTPHLLEQNNLLARFASLTHTIGNFTLVPFQLSPQRDNRSFNQYRGFQGNDDNPYFVYDFFDLSLKLIQENTSTQVFKDYIDTFFLNDYVDKDYRIIPLFKRHQVFLKERYLSVKDPDAFLPQNETELNEYLSNVNRLIQMRSRRIIDALKKQIPNIEDDSPPTMNQMQEKAKGKGKKRFLAFLSFILFGFVMSCISIVGEYQNAGGVSVIIQEYGYSAFVKDFIKFCLYTVKNTFAFIIIIAVVVYALFSLLRLLAKKFS